MGLLFKVPWMVLILLLLHFFVLFCFFARKLLFGDFKWANSKVTVAAVRRKVVATDGEVLLVKGAAR